MDEDEFIQGRRVDLARRTAVVLADLSVSPNIGIVESELHRIVGTCGTFGLEKGASRADQILADVRRGATEHLSAHLLELSGIFLNESEA